MRRVWASLVAVWATLAIVAALAWSQRPAAPATQAAPRTLVVKTPRGSKQLLVTSGGGAPHATTQTSPPPP